MPTLSSSDLIREQIELLKRKPFEYLLQLPSHQQQEVVCSEGRTLLSIWKDVIGQDELRVVVQAYRPVILGIGTMRAVGFRATREAVRELQAGEIDDFK